MRGPWDSYLFPPDPARMGICCSGGGIRSASFCLGGLQVLREKRVLFDAEYLSCVSGGGYITIAHALMTSETIKRATVTPRDPVVALEDTKGVAPEDIEGAYFGTQAPWAAGSPEEEHLRDRLTYLAPGLIGKVWAALNLLYGAFRLLIPFFASLFVAGVVMGFALTRWLRPTLTAGIEGGGTCQPDLCVTFIDLVPFVLVSAGFLGLAILFMYVRNFGQKRNWSEWSMLRYQLLTFASIGIAVALFVTLVAVPQVLLWLHHFKDHLQPATTTAGYSVFSVVVAVVTFVSKHYQSKWFRFAIKLFITLSAPIIIIVPLVGFTYWNAQAGFGDDLHLRVWLFVASLVLAISFFVLASEVTSIAHLFYRERLATAFVGYRRLDKGRLSLAQPPWSEALKLSNLVQGSSEHAKMPKLVVCCAVNLSDGVPVGRNADSFTFDDRLVGGPTTGYKPITWLEQVAPEIATLPTLMAVSGAAVSPSMGKMTRPALRFVMALFDLRLGVWAPNPNANDPWWPWHGALPPPRPPAATETNGVKDRIKQPGAAYILKEAIGANKLTSPHVYVTDGGHWENLGLVELLRRGCMQVICIDGSGGDAVSFGTLSEAIAIARSDLGIQIDIDLDDLRPCGAELGGCVDEDGKPEGDLEKIAKRMSKAGFAEGTITFPGRKKPGKLLYIRAVIPRSAPQDVLSYALKDRVFPNTSTANQLFTDATFEAYRALGRFSVLQALTCSPIGFPPPHRDRDCP